MNGSPENKAMTPQKPVNLLPEVPSQTSRKLSDREQHDCDVIGMSILLYILLYNLHLNPVNSNLLEFNVPWQELRTYGLVRALVRFPRGQGLVSLRWNLYTFSKNNRNFAMYQNTSYLFVQVHICYCQVYIKTLQKLVSIAFGDAKNVGRNVNNSDVFT